MILPLSLALAAPVALDRLWNAELLDPAGKDAVCLRGPGEPSQVVVPVQVPTERLAFTWTLPDGPAVRPGVAVTVTVRWADAHTSFHRVGLGREVAGGVTTGRLLEPVVVGMRGGAPVLASTWTVPLAPRPHPVDSVVIDARPESPRVCLFAVAVDAPPSPAVTTPDTRGWYPFAISGALPEAPPQALPVEAPAGRRGFVRRGPDGHLQFEDGTRARFWGVNLVAEPGLPAREDADAYAATLARLGFNLVRLHHVDGVPPRGVVNPRRTGPEDTFVPEALDRLDYFVSRLIANGVYVKLEVATERTLTAVDGASDVGGLPNGHKLAPMWDPAWRQAYLRWFERYWGRVNPYTGRRYADEPGVAILELSNEHSLLLHWGFGLETLPERHRAGLDARWNEWLLARYGSDAALAAAWTGSANPGLRAGESAAAGTVTREPWFLPYYERFPEGRRLDLVRFYGELERGFYAAVADTARALGFRVPVVPSIHYNQPALAAWYQGYDLADMHFVWDPLRGTWFDDTSAIANPARVLELSAGAVEGRALMISELNHPHPNRYRAEGPLLWATLASVQDWDVLIWFSWADTPYTRDPSQVPGAFESRSAAVVASQMPTASSLFRSGAIPPATGSWVFQNDVEALERQWATVEPARFNVMRLPYEVTDVGFVLGHRIRQAFGGAPRARVPGVASGAVGWHVDPGILVVDRPTFQARVGPPGDPVVGVGPAAPAGLRVRLEDWAAVSLAVTDGDSLLTAKEALLTVATRQVNTGMVFGANGHDLVSSGGAPIQVQPARGVIELHLGGQPIVEVLDGEGRVTGTVAVRPGRKGWWALRMDEVQSPWLRIRVAP